MWSWRINTKSQFQQSGKKTKSTLKWKLHSQCVHWHFQHHCLLWGCCSQMCPSSATCYPKALGTCGLLRLICLRHSSNRKDDSHALCEAQEVSKNPKDKLVLKLILNMHTTRIRSQRQHNWNQLPFGDIDTKVCGSVIGDFELWKLPGREFLRKTNK